MRYRFRGEHLDLDAPMGFLEISQGIRNISPEAYKNNFLQTLLLFILKRY